MKVNTIKETIDSLMEGLKTQRRLVQDDPAVFLKEIIPGKLRGHIKFQDFKNGIVYINAESSSWLYYVKLQKEQLTKDLREKCPAVKEIRIRLGEVG